MCIRESPKARGKKLHFAIKEFPPAIEKSTAVCYYEKNGGTPPFPANRKAESPTDNIP